MKRTVTLSKQKTTVNGKTYQYWVLRWFSSDGKRRSKHLGLVKEMSKRIAEKERSKKQTELDTNPGRRDVGRCPSLKEFLAEYLKARKKELRPGTHELHEQTTRYLKGFFGEGRKLDGISKSDARAFKTALGDGQLAHVNKRNRKKAPEPPTVDQHIRNARTIFNHALADDLITFNPFNHLSENVPVTKDWHYVDDAEFAKMMAAAKPAWKLLFGLARWAGLRSEEALALPWRKVALTKRRLTVIAAADGEFIPKDSDKRVVPISPKLYELLQSYYDPTAEFVIPRGGVVYKNIWRDSGVILKRAGVPRYAKPIHALRKSCITDWATQVAAHVVMEWAGHDDIKTTLNHYLKVSELEYDRAAGIASTGEQPKLHEAECQKAAAMPQPHEEENAASSSQLAS